MRMNTQNAKMRKLKFDVDRDGNFIRIQSQDSRGMNFK